MRWWWRAVHSAARIGSIALWRVQWRGQRNVPAEGGVLLASNHQSFLDPVLVGCGLDREIHFMARRTLFEKPVLGRVIVAMNSFPIERDTGDVKGVKSAIERLKAGKALLMFPEGTRTRDGRIGPMKSGIRLVAERAAVPIVPVLVDGAYRIWPRAQALPALWGEITILYGPPLDPGTLKGDGLRQAILDLRKKLAPR